MEQLWELWGEGCGVSSQRDDRSLWAEMGSPTSLSPKAAQAAFYHVGQMLLKEKPPELGLWSQKGLKFGSAVGPPASP